MRCIVCDLCDLVTKNISHKFFVNSGVVLISLEGEILKYAVRLQFPTTNNEVEYEAFLTRLSLARVPEVKTLTIQVDS